MSHKCAEITASTILHRPFLRKNKTRFNEKARILREFHKRINTVETIISNAIQMYFSSELHSQRTLQVYKYKLSLNKNSKAMTTKIQIT